VATSLEAWYIEHLSWRWIFWNSVVLTPIMMLLIYFGIPRQPLPRSDNAKLAPNWGGFLYASLGLSLLYIALDQGERLDWLQSGTIVALIAAGSLLLLVTVGVRFSNPNPLVDLSFLFRRNTLLLTITLICFRFLLLATLVVVPSYLASIQGFRTLQVGPVLLWGTLPQLIFGVAAMYLLRVVDSRLILTAGFAMIAVACIMDSHLSSVWSGPDFWTSQLVMAVGQAFAFNGLVGSIVLEVVNTGALQRPIDVLTLSSFSHTVRIFGAKSGLRRSLISCKHAKNFIPTSSEAAFSWVAGLRIIGSLASRQPCHSIRAASRLQRRVPARSSDSRSGNRLSPIVSSSFPSRRRCIYL
jgi:DHA2 family multidrug resistance protein